MADPLVVLVHGAWGAPGLWEYLVAELDAAGIRSATADLPTMGSATATLADDADHVRAVAGDGPVVLVGHSYGGAVIAEAALGLDTTHLVYPGVGRAGRGRVVLRLGQAGRRRLSARLP